MAKICLRRRVIDQTIKSQINHYYYGHYHQHGHRQLITTIVQRSLSTSLTTQSSTNTRTINPFNHQDCHPKYTFADIRNFSTEVVQTASSNTNSTINTSSDDANNTTTTNTETKKGTTNVDVSRLIPTRHSSKNSPSIAPVDILDNATDKILHSIPGTLFGM